MEMSERLDLYERRNGDIYIAWTIDDEEGCELERYRDQPQTAAKRGQAVGRVG